jgi:hypothetical protein
MSRVLDRHERLRFETRVLRLQPDSVRQWGRMTPHQAICHVSDAFRMSLKERPAAAVAAAFSPVVRFVALSLPLPWPRGRLKTVPEAEQGAGGTPPTDFDRDRTELLRLIARFCDAGPDGFSSTHPIFGPMTPRNWRRWGYLHTDHHLRQFGV